ncbi:MAG: hypothetical protein HY735_03215 [Verrucomicrobia bacterium]|nr:hypothetical protein [Verrucomicrobiota bacterium]
MGIELKDAHGCAISANTFTINKTSSLTIGPESGRITVTGNNFSNSYVGKEKVIRGSSDLEAAGLKLTGTRDITVSGNLFSGLRPKALDTAAASVRRVLFSDNLLVDTPSDHAQLKDSLVTDNLPEDSTAKPKP